jgi:hypothetical protein
MYLQVASLHGDSLSRMPLAPPGEPDSIVARKSARSTTTDSRGHYALSNIHPGQYGSRSTPATYGLPALASGSRIDSA